MDLVTGGAGFIGSHLVDRLLAGGRRVRVVDSGQEPRHQLVIRSWGDRVELIDADVRDSEALASAVQGAQRVFHLAALGGVRQSLREPDRYWSVNVQGTASVISALSADQKLIYASSSSVYGHAERPSHEEDQLLPTSPYARSKAAAEELVLGRSRSAIVRPFTVYGPRQRPNMAIGSFLAAARAGETVTLYGPHSSRDHTYVDDVVDVLVRAADHDGVFNAGAGRPVTLLQLATLVGQVAGRPLKANHSAVQPGDVGRTWADRTRITEVLGLGEATPLERGIQARGLCP